MVARIEVINAFEAKNRLTDEQYEVLRGIFADIPTKKSDWWGQGSTIADLEDVLQPCTDLGIEIKVTGVGGTTIVGIRQKVARLEEHQQLLKERIMDGKDVFSVHVPNLGLLMMNCVEVREDYCTEALQRDLNDGWHILCVCPPNGTRRPTYILGKHDAAFAPRRT